MVTLGVSLLLLLAIGCAALRGYDWKGLDERNDAAFRDWKGRHAYYDRREIEEARKKTEGLREERE